MPYKPFKEGDQYCVYKIDADGNKTGESLGCHPSAEEAGSQIGAIEANEKMVMRPTQAEVQYTTFSTTSGQGCANCRWFAGHENYCHLIENYPEDILPTGYCDRWEGKPPMEEKPMPVIEAVMVMPEMEMGAMQRGSKVGRVLSKVNAEAVRKAFDALKEVLAKAGLMMDMEGEDPDEMMGKGSFTVFKSNGKDYWKAIWTNNFEDLEGETLSEAAHDRYLARVEKGFVPMPELWYWHIKGTKHGQALWIGRIGHLMLAIGDFDETPLAKAFIHHYRKSREKVSHGFRFPSWAKQNGVYADYNTFEISPLPPDAAANPFTSFEEIAHMALTETQRARLEKIVGKELAAEVLTNTDALSKALENMGLGYKDFGDVSEKAAETDQNKTVGLAFLKLIEAQGELIERQDKLEGESKAYTLKAETIEKALADLKAENEALVKENADLREKMQMTPRASQNAATVVSDDQLKQTMEDRVGDYDEMWKQAGLKVPKGAGNNG